MSVDLGRLRVISYALVSRVLIILWSTVAASLLGKPYEEAGYMWNMSQEKSKPFDQIVNAVTTPLSSWDGLYFLDIAKRGYNYEQIHAFFPLFPLLIRSWSAVMSPLVAFDLLNYDLLLRLSGVIISNCFFVLAAVTLYELSTHIFKSNRNVAHVASVLFCLTPSGIFMSAVYTESLYCFLSYFGMLQMVLFLSNIHRSKWRAWLHYGLMISSFTVSSMARSNGIVSSGFVIFSTLVAFLLTSAPVISRQANRIQSFSNMLIRGAKNWFLYLSYLIPLYISIVVIATPYVLFQLFGYWKYCAVAPSFILSVADKFGVSLLTQSNTPNPALQNDWCFDFVLIPNMYGYVQLRFWDVGFLRFWKLRHIGQFILATPIFTLVICSLIKYVKLYFQGDRRTFGVFYGVLNILSTGLSIVKAVLARFLPIEITVVPPIVNEELTERNITSDNLRDSSNNSTRKRRSSVAEKKKNSASSKKIASPIRSKKGSVVSSHENLKNGKDNVVFSSRSFEVSEALLLLPFALHLLILALVAAVTMHIHVTTRFLTACPFIFWMSALIIIECDDIISSNDSSAEERKSSSRKDGKSKRSSGSFSEGVQKRSFLEMLWSLRSFFIKTDVVTLSVAKKSLLLGYFLLYILLGATLFPNTYNWT